MPPDVGLKFETAEMQMSIWMCGVSMKDRRTSEEYIYTHQDLPFRTLPPQGNTSHSRPTPNQ